MTGPQALCIVCKTPDCVREPFGTATMYRCVRCGSFALSGSAEATVEAQLEQVPIRRSLMSHALRRMQRPADKHRRPITSYDLPSFWTGGRLPTPQQQADMLVLCIGDHTVSGSALRALPIETGWCSWPGGIHSCFCSGCCPRSHRGCRTSGPDLGERWPSRLVATASSANCLT